MKPQLFIHVGLHRTGNSFWQKEVFPKLNDTSFLQGPKVNYYLRRLISEEDISFDPSTYSDYFYPIIQKGNTIISYEGLSGEPFLLYVNQVRNADRLARIFPDATIILGIRRQDAMLFALYLRLIMQGGSSNLARFVGYDNGEFIGRRISLYGRRVNLPMFEFDGIANLFSSRFNGRIRIVVYEHLRADTDSCVRTMCKFLGEESPPEFTDYILTREYGFYQWALTRMLNPFVTSSMNPDGLIPYIPMKGGVKRPVTDILRHEVVRKLFSYLPKNHIAMPKTMSQTILEYYCSSNSSLSNTWGLGLEQWGYILESGTGKHNKLS